VKRKLIERQKDYLWTIITIKIIKTNQKTVDVNTAFDKAFSEFDRVIKKFTRFDDNSELSNLNRNSGKFVKISQEFFLLIEKMLEISSQTDGAFDPTVIDFLEVYGYDKNYDFSKLDNPELDNLVKKISKSRKSYKDIVLDKNNRKVKLAKGQKIDLGGIGKGYAIDCSFNILKKYFEDFLIDAGGDVRVLGKNDKNESWKVALKTRKHSKETILGYKEKTSGSICCSGSWAKSIKQFHHIINPYSGQPVNSLYNTVFVETDNATDADAWATALFVAGDSLAKKLPKSINYFFDGNSGVTQYGKRANFVKKRPSS